MGILFESCRWFVWLKGHYPDALMWYIMAKRPADAYDMRTDLNRGPYWGGDISIMEGVTRTQFYTPFPRPHKWPFPCSMCATIVCDSLDFIKTFWRWSRCIYSHITILSVSSTQTTGVSHCLQGHNTSAPGQNTGTYPCPYSPGHDSISWRLFMNQSCLFVAVCKDLGDVWCLCALCVIRCLCSWYHVIGWL